MRIKVYINNSFQTELDVDVVPRIGEALKFVKAQYRVSDVIWRMKSNGLELLHARVYLK